MYFSYTGKYFKMYFQKDLWKNKKREQGSFFFPKPIRRGLLGQGLTQGPCCDWVPLSADRYSVECGKNRTDSGILAKPEVLGCEAGEKRALGFPESRADPEKDFCGWEKNMTLEVIAL